MTLPQTDVTVMNARPSTASPAPSGALSAASLSRFMRRLSADFWREFMFFFTEHVPPVVLWTKPFFLWFAWRYSRVLRHATLTNARRLRPAATEEERYALARSIVDSAYLSIYELGRAVRLSREKLRACIDDIQGIDNYLAARRAGRGAIIATAHLGPFEVGATAILDRERHVHVVFRRDEFTRFDRIRSQLRTQLGIVEAPIDDGWAIWLRLRDALQRDEVVLIQADRVMPGQKGVPVPFLGGHLLMPLGPIKLARAAGAPLIPIFSVRTSVGRVRVVIEAPIDVTGDDPAAVGSRRAPPALLKLANVIERHVAAHPEQWMMFEPAWCEDRDAGAGPSSTHTSAR